MDKEKTQTNRPEDKKSDDDAQGIISDRWHRLYIYQEKVEDSPELRNTYIYQYDDYIKKTMANNIADCISTNRITE